MEESAADARVDCASVVPSTVESTGWDIFPSNSSGTLLSDFKDAMVQTFHEMQEKAGGPLQYLQARFQSDLQRKKEFAAWLFATFPMSDLESYATGPTLPAPTSTCPKTFCLHVSCFTWENEGSLKGYPEAATTNRILDEVLADGFVTATEPLQVCQRLSGQLANMCSEHAI